MDWKDTPIFIINFNNLDRGFRRLIDWLRDAGLWDFIIVDNASTWPPLLDYYKDEKLSVMHMTQNFGYEVFWSQGMHKNQPRRFIVTDPDLLPDEGCPKDLVRKMHEVLARYPGSKVGPSLRIDDIPDYYHNKEWALRNESPYWVTKIKEGDGFWAPIDTTFALYEPYAERWGDSSKHIRLDFPYVMKHLPWYDDNRLPDVEREYYKQTANKDNHW